MKKLLPTLIAVTLATSACALASDMDMPPQVAEQLAQQNLIWDSPSLASKDSMPIGNGDIGINVWNDPNGDLMLYVGKTDAFDESGRLLKLGRLRIHFANNPFAKGKALAAPKPISEGGFRQELDLLNGEIRIRGGEGTNAVSLRIWVDANHPVIHVETESASPIEQSVKLELWRTDKRPIVQQFEKSYVDGMSATVPPMQYPDTIVDTAKAAGLANQLVWYHRNEISIHPVTLKLQELDPAKCAPDPLLHRTFGCAVSADGWTAKDTTTLQTARPVTRSHLAVCALTAQTPTADAWLKDLTALSAQTQALPLEECRTAHRQWWAKFWSRSWVQVSGGNAKETSDITRGWHLNRFLTACTARGNAPVKFNGAIFTMDGIDAGGQRAAVNADGRAWGTPYWFQNERLIYWPMLQAGDYEQLLPFFKMYRDALPLAKTRTRTYYKHDGALFLETMYFWGAYFNFNYGWNRRGKELGLSDNLFIRRYWQNNLELSLMMLDYYRHTRDQQFARETMMPIASQIMVFYDQHYKRDASGKIHFEPAQANESFFDVVNPLPEIAGLGCVLEGLLTLPGELTTDAQRQQWKRMLSELPPLPMETKNGVPFIATAEINRSKSSNRENINLYAAWPYGRHCVTHGSLTLARDSFIHRWRRGAPYQCCLYDLLSAAYCGLAKEATDHLAHRFVMSGSSRFPAFYMPGDWVPDLDNGGVCQNTIQRMLMQCNGNPSTGSGQGKIVLLPAWPKAWNASFKLHAPENTTVEARVENGKLLDLKVTPESRRKDVEIRAAQ